MKLHYVYYAIQKNGKPKVGATQNVKSRIRIGNYLELTLLEAYTCPKKCGDREIELQMQYFGKRDSVKHYTETAFISKGNTKNLKPRHKQKSYNPADVAKTTTALTREQIEFVRNNYFHQSNQYVKIPKGKYNRQQLADMFNTTKRTISNITMKKFKYYVALSNN